MKKIILSSLLVLAFGFTYAQKAEFGIKGGVNSSNFSGDTEGIDFKPSVGFNVGAFAAIKLSEKITLQPEILFSTQGAKAENVTADVNGVNYTADIEFNLSYINVPVMFKYYVADKFNLEAGPQIGFLTSAETSTKVDGFNQTVDQDAKDYFESVDFGFNLGAGYDFTNKISAGIRYNIGLSNVWKTQPGDNSESQNSVLSLSVGYKF
jgi:hypothetical protein